MFSLELPHRGDSNKYTQYTIFNIKKKLALNFPKSAATVFVSKGLKKEFETAVVNEPSVFEPLKFYCTFIRNKNKHKHMMRKTRNISMQNTLYLTRMSCFVRTVC